MHTCIRQNAHQLKQVLRLQLNDKTGLGIIEIRYAVEIIPRKENNLN